MQVENDPDDYEGFWKDQPEMSRNTQTWLIIAAIFLAAAGIVLYLQRTDKTDPYRECKWLIFENAQCRNEVLDSRFP